MTTIPFRRFLVSVAAIEPQKQQFTVSAFWLSLYNTKPGVLHDLHEPVKIIEIV